VVELGRLGRGEHEPDTAAVEERELGDLEQKPHAERVAIEPHGAADVAHVNGDLADAVERHLVRHGRRHGRLRKKDGGASPLARRRDRINH
jgi:hypothetical protein